MSRYIDATALYKEVEKLKADAEEKIRTADSMSCRIIATTQLAERDLFATLVCWQATKSDVVEVVRCRDCKHFTEGMAIGMCKRIEDKPILPIPAYHFCSFGKKRDGGKADADQARK